MVARWLFSVKKCKEVSMTVSEYAFFHTIQLATLWQKSGMSKFPVFEKRLRTSFNVKPKVYFSFYANFISIVHAYCTRTAQFVSLHTASFICAFIYFALLSLSTRWQYMLFKVVKETNEMEQQQQTNYWRSYYRCPL